MNLTPIGMFSFLEWLVYLCLSIPELSFLFNFLEVMTS
jgi:hypothetical protein